MLGYHTRVDYVVHEVKTDSNWWAYSSNMWGSVTTTLYSGGYYTQSFSGNLNGSCAGGSWTFWFCDAGSTYVVTLGAGSGYVDGNIAIGGGSWGTYGGNQKTGWFYW